MRSKSCTKWNRLPDGLGRVVIMIFGVCGREKVACKTGTHKTVAYKTVRSKQPDKKQWQTRQ